MCAPYVTEADSIADAVAAGVPDAQPLSPLECETRQGRSAEGVALTWSTVTSRNVAVVLQQLQASKASGGA